MHQIADFGDLHGNRDRLRKQLASLFDIEFKPLESILDSSLGTYTVFDFDLNDPTHLLRLKDKLKSRPKDAKVVFVTEKTSRLQDTRAFAIGATDVIHRPVDGRTLLASFGARPDRWPMKPRSVWRTAARASWPQPTRWRYLFRGLHWRLPRPDCDPVGRRGGRRPGRGARACGMDRYGSRVSQSDLPALPSGYRTGRGLWPGTSVCRAPIVSGCRLPECCMTSARPAFRSPFWKSRAGLDDAEMAVMRKHPQYGLTLSERFPDFPRRCSTWWFITTILDGSGYPHGLMASEISDLVRMVTISDVFGALIERRSYKAPLSGDAAYQILTDMGRSSTRILSGRFAPSRIWANEAAVEHLVR